LRDDPRARRRARKRIHRRRDRSGDPRASHDVRSRRGGRARLARARAAHVSDEPLKDPLALGLGSLAAGVGVGSAWMTGAQIAWTVGERHYESIGFWELTAGWFGAAGIGAATAWYRSASLENIWQRGVIAVLAAVGAMLAGFLAAPLDRFFGPLGMLV